MSLSQDESWGYGTCRVMSHVRKESETCPDRNNGDVAAATVRHRFEMKGKKKTKKKKTYLGCTRHSEGDGGVTCVRHAMHVKVGTQGSWRACKEWWRRRWT